MIACPGSEFNITIQDTLMSIHFNNLMLTDACTRRSATDINLEKETRPLHTSGGIAAMLRNETIADPSF